MAESRRAALAGSAVVHRPGAIEGRPLPAAERLQVTLLLRRARDASDAQLLAQVRAFAASNGLAIAGGSRLRRDLILEGTVRALQRAFGVGLREYTYALGSYYGHSGPVMLPTALRPYVGAVLGLDSAPLHRRRVLPGAGSVPLNPARLAAHYGFPHVDARHIRMALIQFGGGFYRSDVEAYCSALKVPLPRIDTVEVGAARLTSGGCNAPLPPGQLRRMARSWREAASFQELESAYGSNALATFMDSMEVTMDVEVAAAMGAGASLAVIFAPPGADGWRRALYAAAGLGYSVRAGSQARADIVSVSWGESEEAFGEHRLAAIGLALAHLERMGIVTCCSSGDRGPLAGFTPAARDAVSFPASSPSVLACGGTTLAREQGRVRERPWRGQLLGEPMASGGGMSGFFERPPHQSPELVPRRHSTWVAPGKPAGFEGRWLPDVAAFADPVPGVRTLVGGVKLAGGGTSLATPLIASLLARITAAVGSSAAGVQRWLYQPPFRAACHPVVGSSDSVGSGHAYDCGGQWNPCTGLGVPDGGALLHCLVERGRARKGNAGAATGE
jgi:kumamolisin